MQRTVSAQAARQRLGELLEGVYYRNDEVVIERAGKPMGVVISPERYAAMEQARQRVSTDVKVRPADSSKWDEDELMQFAVDQVHAYRAEKRAAAAQALNVPAVTPNGT